jgi:hypothetical protein
MCHHLLNEMIYQAGNLHSVGNPRPSSPVVEDAIDSSSTYFTPGGLRAGFDELSAGNNVAQILPLAYCGAV